MWAGISNEIPRHWLSREALTLLRRAKGPLDSEAEEVLSAPAKLRCVPQARPYFAVCLSCALTK